MTERRCPLCKLNHRNGYRAHCTLTDHRWPLGPLVARVDAEGPSAVAVALGHTREAVATAAQFGLSDVQADRWAIQLGYHPAQIWGDWIDEGLTPLDREFIANGWRQAWEWNEAQRPSLTDRVAS